MMKTFNLNRTGGRFLTALVFIFSLAITNAWGGQGHGGPHYATVTAKSTGNGKVYLTATNNYSVKDSEWQTTEMSTPWNCGDNGENDTKIYYFHAKANDGYVFAGWSTSESTNTKTSTITPSGIRTTAEGTSEPGKANTYYAHFWQPMVGTAVCPDDINVSLKGQSGTATVTFNVSRAVAVGNFTGTPTLGSGFTIQSGPTISSLDGNGAGTVSYVLQYTAGATHGESSATIELKSNYNSTSASCTVNANFPNITISGSDPEVPVFDVMPTEVVEGTAEFDVAYAATDGSEFVQWPLVPVVTSGYSGWTITNCTFADGKVTVNYSFNPNGNYGNHSATLTLAATAAAGGASKTLNLGVVINEPSDKAAVVTLGGYEKKWDTFAEALADANSHEGCTLKLLNNCEVNASQAFTKSMTLDLNGFELKRAGITAAGEALLLNTSGKTLYVTDTKPGAKGSIVAVASSGVAVTGIRVGNGCKLLMDKGTINVTTPGATARGIYSTTTPTSENMVVVSDVMINTTAASQSIGIDCESSSTTVDDPTKASVVLSGVTVNVETTGTTDAIAIRTAAGVSLGIQSGTYSATAKTTTAYALQSSGYTAVLGGTFNATATTTTAHALRCEKGITAVRNGSFTATAEQKTAHGAYICDGAKLLTYGGTFKGVVNAMVVDGWATGTQVYDGGTLEAQGGTFIGEANNLSQSSEIAVCAAGIYLNNSSKASYATISNATLQGKINNANLNGAANDTHRGAHGLMTRTTSPVTLTNCTISANTAHKYAFGIRSTNTSVELKNCAVTVNSSKDYNYGIYTYGTAKVEAYNTTITCISQTLRAYGAYIANGSLTAQDCDFTVKTLQTASTAAENSYLRGIYVASGKSATLNGCTVTAQGNATYSKEGYGLYIEGSVDVDNCAVTVSDINTGAYAIYNNGNTTKIGVASGKFKATATTTGVSTNGTAAAAKQQLYGGYYNTNTNLSKYLPAGYGIETLPTSAAEYAEGYRYAIRSGSNLSPVCKIGATPYYSLEEALEYVNKNSGTTSIILMVADYTLPAGNYTLPSNATLLVPYKDGQTSIDPHPSRYYGYTTPSPYKKLSFAAGAHLDVWGKIQAGGRQAATGQMDGKNGCPHEKYGWIYLHEGSSITLENGSHLYAWGYVTGQGEIDAKSGSTVYESFQIKDWRGGSATSGWTSSNKGTNGAFPVTQYYIQNIECPIKFRPGATEKCDGTVNAVSNSRSFNDVKFIGTTGTGSFFEMEDEDMSEDTWVRKWYDAVNDKQVYEVNSSAKMNSISLSLYGYSFSSSDFVLPVTNNMKIHLLTGSLQITQNTELLPGAEIEVDKEATAYINSGKSLYVFDIDDWMNLNGTANVHTYPLPYSPSWKVSTTCPRGKKVTTDAALNIHGKFQVNGNLYTTAGGANIYSSNEDAGTITYGTAAPSSAGTVYVNVTTTASNRTAKTANPAWLKNEDTGEPWSYTSGTASGKSWIYYDSKWNCWEERGCFAYDAQDHPYAKPAAYVQLASDGENAIEDENHLYSDAATGTRAFLVEDGCTWWEVEPTPYDGNKYKCVNPDHNGRYKYYEYVSNQWQEATVTITWMNGSTTLATYSNALYGVRPTYLDVNPSKSATSTEYYSWIGWTKGSVDGKFFAKDADLDEAFEETTYYACFETHKYSYAVLFKNYDGSVLQGTSWEHGQVPYYSGEEPKKPATAAKEYTFTGWSPASFSAVTETGSVYTAQFAESDRQYNVQWVNYDGTVLKEEQVTYGTTPSAPVTPTRPNDSYYTYTFDAWSPEVSAVTGNQTYTATYNYEMQVPKYTATFKNGSKTVYAPSLKSGEVPVFDGTIPTKTADAQYTYTFDGWSTTDGGALAYAAGAALPALTGDVTYYAHFATTGNTYTIRWKSVDDKITYETDTDVPYGAIPKYKGSKPTKARQGATVYKFDGWTTKANGGGTYYATDAMPPVSAAVTYYAHYTAHYTITWKNGGEEIYTTCKYGGTPNAPQPSYPNPQEGYTYEFTGWSPEIHEVVDENNTYTAQYLVGITANENHPQTISENTSVSTATVKIHGLMSVSPGATLTTKDLILEATPSSSGELVLVGKSNVVAENAYFEFSQPGGFKARTWYAVAVPWQVEANGGISAKKGDGDFASLQLGSDIDLIYYRGEIRAASGPINECWRYVEDDPPGSQIMQQGRAYMFCLYTPADIVRFARKSDPSDPEFKTTLLSVETYKSTTGKDNDANWNGIANPATYHAYINANADAYKGTENAGQVYDADNKSYKVINLSTTQLLVGQPVFVQATETKNDIQAYAKKEDAYPTLAPRRAKAQSTRLTRYEIQLVANDSEKADRIIVRMDEDKEKDEYVVGKDLIKMGLSSLVPQIYINRYGSAMCINTAKPIHDKAEYPLGIFAPEAGEYDIFVAEASNEDVNIYLTYNGKAIWNLAYGPYTIALDKGTTNSYGLRLSAPAPQVTTGIEEAVVDAQGETRKVLINNHVFIIRGNNVYGIDGQLIK